MCGPLHTHICLPASVPKLAIHASTYNRPHPGPCLHLCPRLHPCPRSRPHHHSCCDQPLSHPNSGPPNSLQGTPSPPDWPTGRRMWGFRAGQKFVNLFGGKCQSSLTNTTTPCDTNEMTNMHERHWRIYLQCNRGVPPSSRICDLSSWGISVLLTAWSAAFDPVVVILCRHCWQRPEVPDTQEEGSDEIQQTRVRTSSSLSQQLPPKSTVAS